MKITIKVFVLTAALSVQAMAYDYNRSMADEWEKQSHPAETQRIEQDARRRQMELNERLQQIERRERMERQEDELRLRQLEAEQYRLFPR